MGYILAMVEADCAVGPAVMVDQTQVGEQTHTNSLQASLITQSESITLDLQRQTERRRRRRKRYTGLEGAVYRRKKEGRFVSKKASPCAI